MSISFNHFIETQCEEQPAVRSVSAASTSRADRKCGAKVEDAAWGSAVDSGDKFIACVRQDDELLEFFNETLEGDTSYFSFTSLEGDDDAKMEVK